MVGVMKNEERETTVRRIREKICECRANSMDAQMNTPEKALEWVLRELLDTTP